jgi:hypothetical protein
MSKILSVVGLGDHRNTIPMFKRVQSKQVLLTMIDYPNTTSVIIVCNHCKNNLAEIFQESGDYCLHCWQEITCPNV